MTLPRKLHPGTALLGMAALMIVLAAIALLLPCVLAMMLAVGAAGAAKTLLGLAAGSWGCHVAAAAGAAVGFWGGLSRHMTRCAMGELVHTGQLLGAMHRRHNRNRTA